MSRPRFSVRTLAIFVTLVCAYLGAWEATKRYGVNDDLDDPWFTLEDIEDMKKRNVGAISGFYGGEHSPAPLIVSHDGPFVRRHYLWLFGLTIKLPFESTRE